MDSAAVGMTAVIAAGLVPLVSLIKRPTWTTRQSYLVGMIAAIVAAVLGALLDGNVKTWQEGLTLALTALGTSQSVYMLYFRDTDINETLSKK
jgi:ABC-type branched-subunit amino acid transport system permease subunit